MEVGVPCLLKLVISYTSLIYTIISSFFTMKIVVETLEFRPASYNTWLYIVIMISNFLLILYNRPSEMWKELQT